jgi:hypothetical protein
MAAARNNKRDLTGLSFMVFLRRSTVCQFILCDIAINWRYLKYIKNSGSAQLQIKVAKLDNLCCLLWILFL